MAKLTVKDVELKGKKVLVRVDFNVPLKDGVITNDNRITAALPTINYILEQGGRAILFSHLGRVKEEADKAGKSLAPVAKALSEKLGKEVVFTGTTRGAELEAAIAALKDGEILLVENTRFEDIDGKKESKNDPELGKYWASLGEGIFVNDAFGTAHRAHASNVGISANVDKAVAGFLLENEIAYIQEAVEAPERPFVAILGGSKVSDKIGVIENLLTKADKVIIGGGMAYTFVKANGGKIGNSICEDDQIDTAKAIEKKAAEKGVKLVMATDVLAADDFSGNGTNKFTAINEIPDGFEGVDAGPDSRKAFAEVIKASKTILMNGPVGAFENPKFAEGTKAVLEAIVEATKNGAVSVIGGGDSVSAAKKFCKAEDFTHVSTGGGASLEFIEGKVLPGVAALDEA